MLTANDLSPLIHNALLQPSSYPHGVEKIEHISTHISDIYLTGAYVYKFKKPLKFGFLDFSTLALRKFYCEEEIRLNRRFAAQLYVRVVAVSLRDGKICLDDNQGEIIEYAVLMRQFDRSQELDFLLEQHQLTPAQMDELAETIAAFHDRAEPVDTDSEFGNPASVIEPLRDNFTDLYRQPHSLALQDQLEQLETWVEQEWQRIKPVTAERKQQGFVRECHGDLHLGNIAIIDGRITPFDGIEFNPSLYQIDVMSELAFPLMDLDSHQRPELANQLLNQYLSQRGDYGGLRILTLYKVHRALVRAKINALQAAQQTDEQQCKKLRTQTGHYVALATRYTHDKTPQLFITHGLSGSGKTWQSRKIACKTGAIHIRSDVERKRLFAGHTDNLYAADISERTYQHLLHCAETVLQAGFNVIIDATFLDYPRRALFQQLAERLQTRCLILHFDTPEAQLRKNISQRQQQGKDASDANLQVLENQLRNYQPLNDRENHITIKFGQNLTLTDLGL
jgi:hypothetical protein